MGSAVLRVRRLELIAKRSEPLLETTIPFQELVYRTESTRPAIYAGCMGFDEDATGDRN